MKAAILLLFLVAAQPAQAFCLCLKCASGAYRHFEGISAHMLPNLAPKTCFTLKTRAAGEALPPRGTIIGFVHPLTGETHVFRLIGLPGDSLQVKKGNLWLNGAALPQTPAPDFVLDGIAIPRATERLPDGTEYDVLNLQDGGPLDDLGPFSVPEGHVFVLGDNRDNAADSRLGQDAGGPGFVPIASITSSFDSILRP